MYFGFGKLITFLILELTNLSVGKEKICTYIYIYTSSRLKSHHSAEVTSRVAGATKISSHITTLKSHHGHDFWRRNLCERQWIQQIVSSYFFRSKSRNYCARSTYAIFNWNLFMVHGRLHWGPGFDRLVVYALVLTGWEFMLQSWPFTLERWFWLAGSLCIKHMKDQVPKAPNKATETRLILLSLQGIQQPSSADDNFWRLFSVFTLILSMFGFDMFIDFVNVCQCLCWFPQGERGIY